MGTYKMIKTYFLLLTLFKSSLRVKPPRDVFPSLQSYEPRVWTLPSPGKLALEILYLLTDYGTLNKPDSTLRGDIAMRCAYRVANVSTLWKLLVCVLLVVASGFVEENYIVSLGFHEKSELRIKLKKINTYSKPNQTNTSSFFFSIFLNFVEKTVNLY